jgi:hypothetical protein
MPTSRRSGNSPRVLSASLVTAIALQLAQKPPESIMERVLAKSEVKPGLEAPHGGRPASAANLPHNTTRKERAVRFRVDRIFSPQ